MSICRGIYKIMSDKKIIFSIFLLLGSLLYESCAAINSVRGSQVDSGAKKVTEQTAKTSPSDAELQTEDTKRSYHPEPTPTPVRKSAVDNFVCAEPSLPCNHKQKTFEDWELSFRMPAKLIPNKTYKSAPFYAVILKKYDEGCDELDSNPNVEPERQRIQELFSSRKVFAEYSCPNMDGVTYNFAGKLDAANERVLYMDYIAVYAGVTEDEGREIYELLKADYPQAELKKMTAEYTRVEQ